MKKLFAVDTLHNVPATGVFIKITCDINEGSLAKDYRMRMKIRVSSLIAIYMVSL